MIRADHSAKLLRIYLNDHLTVATAAIALARRALRSNAGTPLGDALSDLLDELREDRAELLLLLRVLGLPQDRLKTAAAIVGERLGRVKLNGRLLGYSPLSRVVELEALLAAVAHKQRLWQTLAELASREPLPLDPDRLLQRGSAQLDRLARHHRTAVQIAFGAGDARPVS